MKQLLTALILIGLVGSLSSFGNLADPERLGGAMATPTDYVSWWLDAATFTDRRRDQVIYWSPDEWDINGARMRFPVNPSGDPQEVAIEERGQYTIH